MKHIPTGLLCGLFVAQSARREATSRRPPMAPTSMRAGCDVHSMITPAAKGASWLSPRRSPKKPMTLPLNLSSLFEPRSRLTCAAAMFNSISSLAVLGALACLSMTTTCRAEDFGAKDVLEDARLYFTAPIRWDAKDWLYFAGALG